MKAIDDTQLIEQVRRFPQLYDRHDKDFKFRKTKSKAFSVVAQILDSETSIVQSRWIVLRNRFTTELRNVKNKAPSGATSTWKFFDSLRFLEPHIQSRKAKESPPSPEINSESETTGSEFALTETVVTVEVNNNDNHETMSETNQIVVSEEEHSEIEMNTEAPSISSLREEVEASAEALELQKSRNGSNVSRSSKRKRKGENEVGIALLAALMKFNKCANRQESLTRDEDGDALFGRLVGQYLKKVTGTRDKLELKRKMLSAFLDAGCI